MLTGSPPFSGEDEEELFSHIVRKEPSYPKILSQEAQCLLKGLLKKDPLERLGCGLHREKEIKGHLFFNKLTWELVESRRVQPPWKPTIGARLDIRNFDEEFTQMNVDFSPPEHLFTMNLTQREFNGFSFVNPEFVVDV
ncbi:hypothetical protein Ciccas_004209 [Cichlidogyrus casuarinus]|uniref:AGC-kinase C-terminal domain-containing protein n=1 Tax=Cichlidogyrus casuarinus TaxID=1844966 RepID=A0ABD2QC54_9PLAT